MNAEHLREIFGKFGAVVTVDIAPAGVAFIDFRAPKDAESAQDHMHDGWLDGKRVRVRPATDADRRHARSVDRSAAAKNSDSNNASGHRGATSH